VDPPLVGVAVNVIEPPLQIEVLLAVMDTDAVTEVAVILIGVLVAVVGFAHGSLLVIFTDTASPLARVDVVKVEAVCPATFTPLIIH
jgi:hypothetical protein